MGLFIPMDENVIVAVTMDVFIVRIGKRVASVRRAHQLTNTHTYITVLFASRSASFDNTRNSGACMAALRLITPNINALLSATMHADARHKQVRIQLLEGSPKPVTLDRRKCVPFKDMEDRQEQQAIRFAPFIFFLNRNQKHKPI